MEVSDMKIKTNSLLSLLEKNAEILKHNVQVITGLRDQHQRQARSTEVGQISVLVFLGCCANAHLQRVKLTIQFGLYCRFPKIKPLQYSVYLDISNSTASQGKPYLGLYQISSLQALLDVWPWGVIQ